MSRGLGRREKRGREGQLGGERVEEKYEEKKRDGFEGGGGGVMV